MPVAAAGQVGKRICEALGLDANKVTGVTLRANAGELVHVYVSIAPTENEVEAICAALKHYTLEEAEHTDLPETGSESRTLARADCPR
jgi:hypothetical protein